MRKLFVLFVLSFATSFLVFPQATHAATKLVPNAQKDQESYWHKAVKPDILPVWIGCLAALAACFVGLKTLGSISKQADVADRTLISTFPPKIRIRVMELDVSKAVVKPIENGIAVWKLVVANIGDSNAGVHLSVAKHMSTLGQYVWVRSTGVLVFTDANGVERRIGFRRKYDVITGKLEPDTNPEYEYTDET